MAAKAKTEKKETAKSSREQDLGEQTEKRQEAVARNTASAPRRLVVWCGETVGELHRFDSGWEEEMRRLVERYAPGCEGLLTDPKDAPRAVAEIREGKGFYAQLAKTVSGKK